MGLLGAAAELALSGCLIQTSGAGVLSKADGRYVSASEALDLFRSTVRAATAASAFLVQGVANADQQREALIAATANFPILFIARAAALHAGRGLTRAASISAARDVCRLHAVLARSQRLAPYLSDSPTYPDAPEERVVLLDQLVSELGKSRDLEEKVGFLRSAFLVLPSLPQEQPEWLSALARISVVPTERDVTLLISALEQALPVSLKRTTRASGGKCTVAVVVRPDDPNALPIAPHFLRTEFTKIPDQWRADIAQANGRIKTKILDVPPTASVREVFALGLEKTGVLDAGASLGPHEAWPSIASSLHELGTPGPYWFIVRRVDDLSQLVALVKKAGEYNKQIRTRLPEFVAGVDGIKCGSLDADGSAVFKSLADDTARAELARTRLAIRVANAPAQARRLPEDIAVEVARVGNREVDLGPVLLRILDAGLDETIARYWARVLSEAVFELEDALPLLAVLGTPTLTAAHTAARKALRLIDFRTFGPPLAS